MNITTMEGQMDVTTMEGQYDTLRGNHTSPLVYHRRNIGNMFFVNRYSQTGKKFLLCHVY